MSTLLLPWPSRVQAYEPTSLGAYELTRLGTYEPMSVWAYEPWSLGVYEPRSLSMSPWAYEPMSLWAHEFERMLTSYRKSWKCENERDFGVEDVEGKHFYYTYSKETLQSFVWLFWSICGLIPFCSGATEGDQGPRRNSRFAFYPL